MKRNTVSRWVGVTLAAAALGLSGPLDLSGIDSHPGDSSLSSLTSSLTLAPHRALAGSPAPGLPDLICPLGAAKAETAGPLQGRRRLALVVGVGDYVATTIPKLEGPSKDAEKVYDLLVNPVAGFGFPKENVCFMKDHAATHTAFRDMFQKALVARAQDGDVVVVYYAGHGSQSPDGSGDEADGLDETLMLVDARSNGEIDLVDDEFNYLLAGLFNKMGGAEKGKSQLVTVLLDSCNSGTATRAVDSPIKSRFFDVDKVSFDKNPKSNLPAPKTNDSGDRWDGDELPGLVFVSAAIDGTAANEIGGEGLFTKGLVQTLRESAGQPMTYHQLVLRIRQLIPSYSAGVNQKVDAQGAKAVENLVFGASTVGKPPVYDVKEAKDAQVTLQGTALPGWSAEAVVRIYAWPPSESASTSASAKAASGKVDTKKRPDCTPGTTRTVADLQDPKCSKGTVVLDSVSGLGAKGRLVEGTLNGKIIPGDIAVLAIAGKDSERLKILFWPQDRRGGVPDAKKQAILKVMGGSTMYQQTLEPVEGRSDGVAWTVAMNSKGRLQLYDPAGVLRSTYTASADREAEVIVANFHQMARQRALLQLKGEGGNDFVNDETVQVWAEELPPLEDIGDYARICPKQNNGHWDSEKNGPGTHNLEIPLCHRWVLKAKVAVDSKVPLYVGGLILSTDGSIFGFPGGEDLDEQTFVLVKPGDTYTFEKEFIGLPPINAEDRILVFGTREDNKVDWSKMAEPASTRGVGTVKSKKATTWTSTTLTLKIVANSLMTAKADPSGKKTREYTVQKYDIREMLPANQDSALYKLLMQTYDLTNRFNETEGGANGPRYNQDHEGRWEKLSDDANLAKGIDCSRSIWYAFTRANLQYSKASGAKNKAQPEYWPLGAYVSTAEMIDPDSLRLDQIAVVGEVKPSPLRAEFQSCRNEAELRPGDVLVYRRVKGQNRVDGHVVMVIDPAKNIAWGSHAWDGAAPKGSPKVDTGVEYQWIKSVKKGMDSKWDAWDTGKMVMVDCWRHKQIALEWDESPLNRSGTFDMNTQLVQTASPSTSPKTK